MTRHARRGAVVGGLAAVLLVVVMMARDDAPGETKTPARRTAAPVAAPVEVPVADVKLELLQESRPELAEAERNLFRFQPRAAPTPPRPRAGTPVPVPVPPPVAVPSGPAPPPPIPLRFIGLLDAPTQTGRLAILSDGRGNVFYGREGDIIEGRYRVLKTSPDMVELAYIDGRGRQAIRLSGQ